MKNSFTRAVETFMARVGLFLRLARRPFLGALVAAVIPVMWIFVLHGREEMIHGRTLVTIMEALCYDLPFSFRAHGRPRPEVLLVEIAFTVDSARLDRNNDGKVDRGVMAEALRRLNLLKPTLVVVDCLFSDLQGDDTALKAALQDLATNAPVILATSSRGRNEQVDPSFVQPGIFAGLADVENRPGNTVRLLPGVFARGDARSVSWIAATALRPSITNETQASELKWINYYGPSHQTFQRISFLQLLDLAPEELLRWRGCNVFVGSVPPDESFRSPIAGEEIGGMEIHATSMLNLLNRDWLSCAPVICQLGLFLAYAIGIGVLLARFRGNGGRLILLISAMSLTLLAFASHLLFGVWWWWVILVPQAVTAAVLSLLPTGYVVFISYKSTDGQKDANVLENGLSERGLRAYLDPGNRAAGTPFETDLYRRIRKAPIFLLVLSPDARKDLLQDTWVAKEARKALELKRRIIVVRPYLAQISSEVPGAAAVHNPVAPLKSGELPKDLVELSELESVLLETGTDRKAALDRICRL